jgi:hypothetical protein
MTPSCRSLTVGFEQSAVPTLRVRGGGVGLDPNATARNANVTK